MTFPGVDEIVDYWQRMVTVLGYQRNAYDIATTTAGPFLGMTRVEYEDVLDRLRDELDKQVVLAMVASAEGSVRIDAERRVERRTKDRVRREFQNVLKKHKAHLSLTRLLEVWKGKSATATKPFSDFAQLLKHRHWLAHGRYWTDKSGVVTDPMSTKVIVDRLFETLQQLAPDFPLG